MVRIASVNVNGLNNKTKRQNTFRWLDKQRFDIILLQETHCINAETENSWTKDWSGDSFWNYGTNLSNGVSVLFIKSHTFNINSVTDFVDGKKKGKKKKKKVRLDAMFWLMLRSREDLVLNNLYLKMLAAIKTHPRILIRQYRLK